MAESAGHDVHSEMEDPTSAMVPAIDGRSSAGTEDDPEDELRGRTTIRSKALRDILLKPVAERSREEVDEVFHAVDKLQVAFLANLDKDVKRAICRRLKWEEFEKDSLIFDYGAEGDKLYLIWSGTVELKVPKERAEGSTMLHWAPEQR
ncbi:hypothetical protein AK812_SmicGene5025 [Symbiodinium microadriaticum]|uniref:Cyclic nucleotide-binding domain-containing protein n=1 Tax=Symbiodinium microadriaticum TaxID=2951 RepID=A0A1Q9EUR8_SYMMI|nr:hypothetical protein AK812_SmicGene5025 [Symbiodinium microadriaticum]